MKTIFMMMQKFTTPVLFLILIVLSTSCSHSPFEDVRPTGKSNEKKTSKYLLEILDEFAETEENKDAEGHRLLYVSGSSTLNFVLKNYGTPVIASLKRDEWIGYFSSWDYEYFPEYKDIKFYIEKGMAIDSHKFQGYKDGQPDIYGTDLFMYIETQKGWKLLTVASAITYPDDEIDYGAMELIASTPEEAFFSFESGLNNQERTTYEKAFLNPSSPCFRMKNKFMEDYSDDSHSASAFYDAVPENMAGLNMDLQGLKIDVYEQLTAVASSSYTIKNAEFSVEKGEMLASLVATPDQGWKITSMVFSAK